LCPQKTVLCFFLEAEVHCETARPVLSQKLESAHRSTAGPMARSVGAHENQPIFFPARYWQGWKKS
jgi:hypothetical protein